MVMRIVDAFSRDAERQAHLEGPPEILKANVLAEKITVVSVRRAPCMKESAA
jgi:hypothetical protein